MKNFKKLMALVVAMVMVVGTMSMAFATDTLPGDAETTIKITGLAEGDKVSFYQVASWADTDPETWGGWKVTSDFTSVIPSSDALGNIIDAYKTGYTGITSEVAGDLSRASGKTALGNSPYTVGSTGEIEVPVSELAGIGLYMAIITPKDVNTVYNPVFVSADYFTGGNSWNVTPDSTYSTVGGAQAAAKKSTLTLTKDSTNAQDTELANGQASDPGDTTKPGDTLTFTVHTTIPGYGKTFDHPAFVLKDTMDTLTYNEDIEIYLGNDDTGTKLEAPTNYAVTSTDATGYKITFDEEWLRSLDSATAITAIYTATVNELDEGTYENIEKEQNTVEIEYSHNPETETGGKPGGDKEYKKDITNHYTFSIDANNIGGKPGAIGESMTEIIKIAVDREGNPIYSEKSVTSTITTTETVKSPLAGATFNLYKEDGATLVGTAVSDDNGRLLFEGLDEGTYILREMSAPTGFIKDTEDHTIVIDAKLESKHYTEWYDQAGNWYDNDGNGAYTKFEYDADELVSYTITFDGAPVASHTFDHEPAGSANIKWSSAGSRELPSSIKNTQGVELPSTGGMGTTLFYAIGAILVLGAGILLVSKRRMSAN